MSELANKANAILRLKCSVKYTEIDMTFLLFFFFFRYLLDVFLLLLFVVGVVGVILKMFPIVCFCFFFLNVQFCFLVVAVIVSVAAIQTHVDCFKMK